MTADHNYSFFGKNQAFIIITRNLRDKVHFNFIRKNKDGSWQHLPEGLHIELSIEEICKISDFLNSDKKSINIIHKHPNSTQIKNFKFEKQWDPKNKTSLLFIKAKIDNDPSFKPFPKPLIDEQIRFFKIIIEHLEQEKIVNYKRLELKSEQ